VWRTQARRLTTSSEVKSMKPGKIRKSLQMRQRDKKQISNQESNHIHSLGRETQSVLKSLGSVRFLLMFTRKSLVFTKAAFTYSKIL